MSFENFVMCNAVVPSYDTDKDKKGKDNEETVNADDPANNDKIKDFLKSLG
jgi:hypothetical protein